MEQKIILFGAGKRGLEALEQFGDKVVYFCDNDFEKIGQFIEGKEVISFNEMVKLRKKGYYIIVTPLQSRTMCQQLKQHGIHNFIPYYSLQQSNLGYFECYECMERQKKLDYKELDLYLNEVEKLDLLTDISRFKSITKHLLYNYKVQKNKKYIEYKYGESGFYGNLDAILNYAEMNKTDIKYFPTISHLDTHVWGFSTDIKKGVIISGERYKKFIHKNYSYVPVYTIGPYIHYVEGIYSEEQLKEMKEKYGKILTIFMPHSTEAIDISYREKEFVDRILARYEKQFDTIWACVYWTDINSSACMYLEQRGIHIVSAGFRFDSMFDRRLKTILELSDGIACGGVGTMISFALYLNKPVAMFFADQKSIDSNSRDDQHFWMTGDAELCREGYKQIFNEELKITKEQIEFMNEVSGFDKVRDKSYFKVVLEISKDIWKLCGYDESKYPIGVYSAYEFYRRTGDIEKLLILREALGDNFI